MTRQESNTRKSGKKNVRQRREPARLTGKLDKNLVTYALAASAAGVGMMALTPAAQAEVIATQVNISVPPNGGLIEFDINKDGQMDFGLSIFSNLHTCTQSQAKPHRPGAHPLLGCGVESNILTVVPIQAANEIWQAGTSYGEVPIKCAADLIGGVRIGSVRPFAAGALVMGGYSGSSIGFQFCPWRGNHPPKPFLGVKFVDTAGNVHFGWVRITVTSGLHTTITGYAYETIPNKAIVAGVTHGPSHQASLVEPRSLKPIAPEPASLGMLALGAPGLVAWRRQDEAE